MSCCILHISCLIYASTVPLQVGMPLRSEMKRRPERNEGIGKPRISGSDPRRIGGILASHTIDILMGTAYLYENAWGSNAVLNQG